MFSPSQLLQSMTQRAPVTAPKPIELVPGQVFRGTVIRQYPNQMSLVQIGPLQVQAKMEANLEPGQKAWLQVQPSTDVVTLKVLDTPEGGAKGSASLEGLMRSLGLPESKESRAIVQALLNGNQPVTKETVQAFMGVVQKLGMDDATIQAFMTALKRNLPLTADSVAGLKAFLFDRPLSQTLQNFLQQAALFLETGEKNARSSAAPLPGNGHPVATAQTQGQTAMGDVRHLIGQLRERVASLPVLLLDDSNMQADKQVTAPPSTGPRQNGAGQVVQANVPQPLSTGTQPASAVPLSQTSQSSAQPNSMQMPGGSLTDGTVRQAVPSTSDQASVPLQTQQQNPSSTVSQGIAQTIINVGNPAPNAASTGAAPTQPMQENQPATTLPNTLQPAMTSSNVSLEIQTQTVPPAAGSNPIQQLFQQLGISHERELMGQVITGSAWDAGAHKQMESVKAMLLQLTQNHTQAIPPALREAADQLLQQVTGQQLMLAQPVNQSLSQIIMQIPLRTEQGDDTAYVQIESKKKGAGQLDAENCRLFFHLDLQALGLTMIDVNIVNKIISLQIFNDTPGIESLAHAMKGGFTEQLHELGYQLSSMRVQAIPQHQQKASAAKSAMMSDYKGVDLRI